MNSVEGALNCLRRPHPFDSLSILAMLAIAERRVLARMMTSRSRIGNRSVSVIESTAALTHISALLRHRPVPIPGDVVDTATAFDGYRLRVSAQVGSLRTDRAPKPARSRPLSPWDDERAHPRLSRAMPGKKRGVR
jgi:hypothetical protein